MKNDGKIIAFPRRDRLIDRCCPYQLSEDVVRLQQRLFCEGLAAKKHLERNRRQTISTAVFVRAYPGSRKKEMKVTSLHSCPSFFCASTSTLIVGEETHKYNLSSSCIHDSISCWTEFSSCIPKKKKKSAI